MKEGYKKTELGWIPEQWEVRKLKDLGEGIIGLTYSPDDLVEENGTLVLRSSNIKENRLLFNDNKYVNKKIPEKLITKENDILICSRNGSKDLIGKCALINKDAVGNSFGAFMTIYRGEYNKFLFQVFNSYIFKRQIYNNLGATINQITTDNLNNFKVPFPPLKEQQKIVDILSTVDSQIDNTDKLIEKTRELKKGLMQSLLTRGIGHKEFRKTEIGEIPVEWEVRPLGEICEFRQGFQIPRTEQITEVKDGYVRYLYITDFFSDENKLFIKDSEKYYYIGENDITIANTGNTCGKAFKGAEGVLSNNMFKIFNDNNVLLLDYLWQYLNSNMYWEQLYKYFNTAGQPHVGHKNMAQLLITLPNCVEQQKISEILLSVDDEIEEYENKKNKLEELKRGLMQQLLTGKIRTV